MKRLSWSSGQFSFFVFFLFASSAPALVAENPFSDALDSSIVGLQVNDQLFCSGAFLSPRLILTAGHCVTGTKLSNLSREMRTTQVSRSYPQITLKFTSPQTKYGNNRDVPVSLAKIHRHPKWPVQPLPSHRDISIFSDLAILELSEDVAGTFPLPVDFSPAGLGENLVISGLGLSDADCLDETTSGHLKTTVMEVEKYRFHDFGFRRRASSPSKIGAHFCPGDSGGPVLRYNEKLATYFLIGVNSFSEKKLWFWGSNTDWAVRLDLEVNRQWISEIMARED